MNKNIGFVSDFDVIIALSKSSFSRIVTGITSLSFLRIESKIVIGVLNVIAFNSMQMGLEMDLFGMLKKDFGSDFISFNI